MVARGDAVLPEVPAAVAAALASPLPGERSTIEAGGRAWSFLTWGSRSDPPLLLVHGVTSNAGIWWRVGPALAASGRRVTAVDMPGHGPGGSWSGRHRLAETAADIAAFIRALALDTPELVVVGHSWGAATSAHLPRFGIRPRTLVLIDPPYLTREQLEALTREPDERPYASIDEARASVRRANPAWSDGDVDAKAQALTEFNADAVLAVLVQNGDWDAGLAALREPEAEGLQAWLIAGEWATGGLIPDSAIPAIRRQLGADRVIVIRGAPHSPQRTHPQETVAAILGAVASA